MAMKGRELTLGKTTEPKMDREFSVVFINYGKEVFVSFMERMQSEGHLPFTLAGAVFGREKLCLNVSLLELSVKDFISTFNYLLHKKLSNSIPLLCHQCYLIVFLFNLCPCTSAPL